MKGIFFKLIWLGISATLLISGCARQAPTEVHQSGQNGGRGGPVPVRTSADVVKLGGSGVGFSAGSSAEVPIPLSIEPGYHLNANPATFEYLIATEVTVDKSDGLTFSKPIYPAAEKKKFQFAEEPLAVYEGQVQIKLPVQAAPNAAKGKRSLSVHVRIQACDQEKCFPPDTIQATPAVDVK
jgi:hypothetical protein